ncbi:Hypothetical Protein FCC1311_088422 [Hondaea fermentalgiana]|uniref:PH domain-containing protein n=1 Tax=Hondaea fermentalgiana TaxID=2315210 RepID=A0A2R5GP18_9STRA|nr:Hypothetical Protein FCC1311_088422 [Hondaea fermentalgiana]|eukprot:GBG32617.1 Hypothetical Protein FCC1311_088422 [Hondaea fermentalgiana]
MGRQESTATGVSTVLTAPSSSFRSGSFDDDEMQRPGTPLSRPQSAIFDAAAGNSAQQGAAGTSRLLSARGVSSNISVSSCDDGERSPRAPSSPSNFAARHLGTYTSSTLDAGPSMQTHMSNASAASTPLRGATAAQEDAIYAYDCDPRAWILAAGRLEKKRDGNWKAGWGKRFFVLTPSTLYYYLVPRRGGKGETSALLGDERGHIRIAEMRNMYTTESATEGSLIHLDCGEIKKNSMTQSNNTNIVLRAKNKELAEKWVDLLRRAHALLKQAQDPNKIGAGQPLDGYVPSSMFSIYDRDKDSVADTSATEAVAAELSHELTHLQAVIFEHVLPVVESSKTVVPDNGQRAIRIDPYMALACLIAINMICYAGPSMGNVSVAMLLNLAFLSFIVYYEKLANEHDAAVFRYNKAVKLLQGKFDRVAHYLQNPHLVDAVPAGADLAAAPGSTATAPSGAGALASPSTAKSPAAASTPAAAAAAAAAAGAAAVAAATATGASGGVEAIDGDNAGSASAAPAVIAAKVASGTASPYEINGKPAAGSTMKQAPEDDQQECTWDSCEGSVFSLRQVGYKVSKQKAASAPPLYELVGMDLLKGDNKLDNIHSFVNLPPPRKCDDLEVIKASGCPRLFVVNIQVPLKAPSMFGGEDPGVSVVFYFAINPETAKAAAEDAERPEVLLWKRFCTEFEYNEDVRRRFKGIGMAANISDLPIPKRLHSLNGKPVILFKTAHLERAKNVEGGCIEACIMVHKFGMIARTIFSQFRETSESIRIRSAFLVQGEEDYELPECVLGTAKITRLNFEAAKHINHL